MAGRAALEDQSLTADDLEDPSRTYTRHQIALGVSAPLVVLALFAATWNLGSDLGAVRHSHAVIDEIMAVRAATRQSREALHRYLQEGDAAQKPIYRAESESAWHSVWRAKELTLDNPRQKANAALFEQEVGDTFKLT